MPTSPDFVQAQQALDKAVDLCYRPQLTGSELARIEFLFGLYKQYTASNRYSRAGGSRKKEMGLRKTRQKTALFEIRRLYPIHPDRPF